MPAMLSARTAGSPLASPASVVLGPHCRVTVLDAGLVRVEWSPESVFEDRASQVVVDRSSGPVDFAVTGNHARLDISTELLHLTWDRAWSGPSGLTVRAVGGGTWNFGTPPPTLGGTVRTLDGVDGGCPLGDGVLSRSGVVVLDDTQSYLLDDAGEIAPRHAGNLDLYVFAYGTDHRRALQAFYRLTGPQPLLPRYALGNWWSRYHPYRSAELVELVDRFAAERIPLSVVVLDMDWHWVDIDPRNGSGWTGYSWNTDLIPDPPALLAELRRRGLRTALNVHPAEGVNPHEDRYGAVATRMGLDPALGRRIPFDPTDPTFVAAYFEELHHPLEADGVDVWWIDWQQGETTRLDGLDPLWLLNHLHYLDSGRDGRRALTFSRFAGPGSHRYPIGFSGDTVASWESLAFQPHFTATASNIGYGWWSHDIGGHYGGKRDDELYTRWVQLGVFSPILRLHSTQSRFHRREPWAFEDAAHRISSEFLRLRHQLVPYLYTMNRRAHDEGEPLVQPMYYAHPDVDDAYQVPNQYMFGDRVLVAPVTTPVDPVSRLATVSAWLPPGRWVDFFTGQVYRGGRRHDLYRPLDTIPVLVPAGTLLPLAPAAGGEFGTTNPQTLQVRVYAGADGRFTLHEDHDDERWASTGFGLDHTAADQAVLTIHPVAGDRASVPDVRDYTIVLCGFGTIDHVGIERGDGPEVTPTEPGPVPNSVQCRVRQVTAADGATVTIRGDLALTAVDAMELALQTLDRSALDIEAKDQLFAVVCTGSPVEAMVSVGGAASVVPALVELLTATVDLTDTTTATRPGLVQQAGRTRL